MLNAFLRIAVRRSLRVNGRFSLEGLFGNKRGGNKRNITQMTSDPDFVDAYSEPVNV